MQSFDKPMNLPSGTDFKLYGYAISKDGKTINVTVETRRKFQGASLLMVRDLVQSFPATKAGERKACDLVASLNDNEAIRLRAERKGN